VRRWLELTIVRKATAAVKVLASEVSRDTNANGLFCYSTDPGAPGTLIFSVTEEVGEDEFTNAYLAGITGYSVFMGGVCALNISNLNGHMVLATAATEAGPWTVQGYFGAPTEDARSGVVQLLAEGSGTAVMQLDGNAAMALFFNPVNVNGPVTAVHPGDATGTAETWQTATPPSGATGLLRYQLVASPPNCVMVQADLAFSPAVSGSVTLFTLPTVGAGYPPYRPSDAFYDTGSGVSVSTGGVVSAVVPAGTTKLGFALLVPTN
jgi:hypothetical protein